MTYPVIKLRGSYSPALSLTNAIVKDAPLTSLELDTNFFNISSLIDTLAPKSSPILLNPVLNGNALVDNPALSSNSWTIANTWFVNQKLSNYTLTTVLNTALAEKATSVSPAFTGAPTAPTASSGTNNAQIATTEFVENSFVKRAGSQYSGTHDFTAGGASVFAPTMGDTDNTTNVATTTHVKNVFTAYGLSTATTLSTTYLTQADATSTYSAKAGSVYTGAHNFTAAGTSLTAPTMADGDNTTKVATTTHVKNVFTAYGLSTPTTLSSTYLTKPEAISTYAPLASATLTGVPAAPTAANATNTTQIATTQFVKNVFTAYGLPATTTLSTTYLTQADATSTYSAKAGSVYTGTHNFTAAGTSVTAPTMGDTDNTTKVATTTHVKNVFTAYGLSSPTTLSSDYAAKAGATFTGVLRAPTPVDASGNPDYTDHSTKLATTEWINGRFDNKADINNETFTGLTTVFNGKATNALESMTTPAQSILTTNTNVPNIGWVNTRLLSFSTKTATETLYNKTIVNLTGTGIVNFSGATSVTAPTVVDASGNPDYTDHSTKVATTEWINGRFDNKADVNNETFTGITTIGGTGVLTTTPAQDVANSAIINKEWVETRVANFVSSTGTGTLADKTLTSPILTNATANGTLTLGSTPLQTAASNRIPNIGWITTKLNTELANYVTPTGSATLANKSLTSPTLTGSPLYQVTIPASTADATVANTQFVDTNFLRKTDAATTYLTQADATSTYAPLNSPVLVGSPTVNTSLAISATGQHIANIDWVRAYTSPLFALKADVAAPTLSGIVTLSSAIPANQADTRAVHANWVRGFVTPLVDTKASKDSAVFTTSVTLPANFPATDSNGQDAASTNWVRGYTNPLLDLKADLAGPANFSGVLTATTAPRNTNSITVATTSFVQNEFGLMTKNLLPKAMTAADVQYNGEVLIPNKGYLRTQAGFSPSTGRPQYTFRGRNIGAPNQYWANIYVGELHVSDSSIRMGDGDGQATLQATATGGLVLPAEVALGGEANTIPTNLASTDLDKAYASTSRPSSLKMKFTVDSGASIPFVNGAYPVFLNTDGNIEFLTSADGQAKDFIGFVDHNSTSAGQELEVQVQGLLTHDFSSIATYSIPFENTDATNAIANQALTFSFGGATATIDLYDETADNARYTGLTDAALLTELNAQLTAQSIPFTATITSGNTGFTFTHSTIGAIATPVITFTGLETVTDTAGTFITNPATTYTITSTGGTVTDTAGSFTAGTEYTIVSTGTITDTATSFTIDTIYTIVSVGTTDFTLIGSANNTVGTVFTATGVGTGTGTASKISTDFTLIGAANNTVGTVFTANGVGSGTGTATKLSTDFTSIGSANNTVGTVFIATGAGIGLGTATRSAITTTDVTETTVLTGASFTPGTEIHINSSGEFLTAGGPSTEKIGKAVSVSQLFLYTINTIPEYIQSQVKVDLNSFSVNPSATPSGEGSLAYNNTNGQLTFTPPKAIVDATLTGTPTVPTAAPTTDSTQAASTAFVKAAIDALVAAAPETLNTLNEIAAAINNEGNFAATVARLASPTFTGTVTVPEPTGTSNDQTVATTAFVRSTAPPLVDAALSGVPTAPTAAFHTETTQIATTEFVATAVARGGGSSNLDGGLANTTRTIATHHFDGGTATS